MSVSEGRAAAVEGMNKAYKGACQHWKDKAEAALAVVMATNKEFTTDDVWYADPSLEDGVTEPRAMGGVMMRAKKNGWITTTDKWEASGRTVSHSRPLRVWRVTCGS